MPQIAEHHFPGDTVLRLWQVTETIGDLMETKQWAVQPEAYSSIKLDKRKREWLGLQWLLHTNAEPLEIKYADTGKPVLDQDYISLSHAEDFVALVTSPYPVGIDIQSPTPQLERIKGKFCRGDELEAAEFAPNKLAFLTRVWSAKEALFKIYGSDVDFREEMAFSCEEQDHIFLLKEGSATRHDLFYAKHAPLQLTVCLRLGR